MPNKDNITSPITLFGINRSGTSVLYRAIVEHPSVDGCGESASLIFTTWRALEQISGLTRYGKIDSKDYGADAAVLVRRAFLKVFPSDKTEWAQKPIGVPRIHRDFPGVEPHSDAFVEWYWTAFRRSFPRSRNFAILRHPLDTVASATKYLGCDDAVVWRSLKFLYAALAKGKDDMRIVVRYSDMIADPAAALKRICDAVELQFVPRMTRTFNKLHVPVRGTMYGSEEDLAGKRASGFSRRDEWDRLRMDDDAKHALDRYYEPLSLFGLPTETEQLP